MKRIKLKYSKQETKNDLYTFGKEWQLEDGTEYVGTYHQYTTTNETYTESNWNATLSKPLFEYQDQIITQQQNLIGPKDKEIGFIVVTKKLTSHNKDQINLESESNVFFVSSDLKNKYEVLKDVDEVITNKQLLNNWSVVYKKDLGIHHALYSLSEHKIISDKVVASLSPVK